MLRRVFLSLALGLAASCAIAQTAPSPADVGISKGTPDVFKLKGHDNVWTPFGTIDPSTHVYIPGTNGAIAPNDCVKWGPGLTSAGAACNSVTGGAHPANQLTIYTNHAGLVANVTTPTEAWTVQQQGFYAPGDGGQANYQWSFTSYCANGTSSAPTAADGVGCVLPAGQSASVAGRYLLTTNGSIDVRQVGMKPDGFDNSPLVQTLMNTLSPASAFAPGIEVVFASVTNQASTFYYFSQPFVVSRGVKIACKGANVGTVGPTVLTFPPGVDGVIQENSDLTPDGGGGASDLDGCMVLSLGGANPNASTGSYKIPSATVAAPGSGYVGTSGTMTFNYPSFCTVNPVLNVTVSGGQVTTVTSVANQGNCPGDISGFANWTPGGGLSGGSGAIFNVTTTPIPYTDNTIRNVGFPTFGGGLGGGPFTLPAACNPVGNSCSFGVGDGVIATAHYANAPVVAPGAYISASNPGAGTITLASPYVTLSTANTLADVIDLPAAQKFTIQTTAGSNTATVTAGPRSLKPGDMLWSDAFLFGSTVMSATLTGFPQTITVNSVTLTAPAPALVTHGSGSPGQMWTIPGGVVRRTGGSTRNNTISHFGVGIDLVCASGTGPITGCNGSHDAHNTISNNVVGRLARGNDTGVSTITGNVFNYNTMVDEVEAGTLGSTYSSEEYVSVENQGTLYGILVLCGSQNYSSFIGSYLSGQAHGPCMGPDAQGNDSIGVPANDTYPPSELFISSIYGYDKIDANGVHGQWKFSGANSTFVTAPSATPSGNIVAVPTTAALSAGTAITDQTHPGAIPANTTITQMRHDSVVISNSVTGGGVQAGDQIAFTGNLPGSPCITVKPGLSGAGLLFDTHCDENGVRGTNIFFNGYTNSWDINGDTLKLPNNDSYLGYNVGGPVLTFGVQLGSFPTLGTGTERLLDSASAPPTTQPGRLQGDTRLNNHPVPGAPLAWTNVQKFSTTLSANVTGGTTISVTVAACPSPALPAGTPVIDGNGFSIPGVVSVSREIGTLASCTAGTLTLQAAATNDGVNGDTIQFLEWHPSALIANDVAGTSWPVANRTLVGSLPLCSGDDSMGLGVVLDGQTSAAAGYNVAVGSTTGATHRLVFCDGTSWTYH